jgi:Methylamine utilisation protein MauE
LDATAVRLIAGAILAAAGIAKLAAPSRSRAALAPFAPPTRHGPLLAWATLTAAEIGLGAAVAAGSREASYAAGALMACFAAVLVAEIARGHAGRPCACFGSRGKVGWLAVARNVALAALYLALPSVGEPQLSATGWLAIGLAVALAAIVALAVLVLGLAREVGALRMAIGPQAALEIPDEGPELGARVDLIREFAPGPDARTALAVFTSDGCPVCHALEPAIEFTGRDPLVALRLFDEHRDHDAWRMLDVPGSPFAVALDLDGTVLAKGTFNTLGQLESVLATAVRRRGGLVNA